MTVDVWMQHPTQRLLSSDMFASLRRWVGDAMPTGEIPLDATLAAMDAAGIDVGLLSAGPVAGFSAGCFRYVVSPSGEEAERVEHAVRGFHPELWAGPFVHAR